MHIPEQPHHNRRLLMVFSQGPRRVKKVGVKHTPMASAGARAYNGGLGAEPPAGVQGAEPPVGVSVM